MSRWLFWIIFLLVFMVFKKIVYSLQNNRIRRRRKNYTFLRSELKSNYDYVEGYHQSEKPIYQRHNQKDKLYNFVVRPQKNAIL